MSAVIQGKQITWTGQIDSSGYRTYKILWLIRTDDYGDGPAIVLQCPGLPLPGSIWDFDNDYDPWVWCRFDADAKIHEEKKGTPTKLWTIEQTFSNKPLERQKCNDMRIEDPLLEYPKLSGGFVRRTREATTDRFNKALVNSAWEMLRGQQVEFDDDDDQVKIEQNVLNLDLATVEAMKNTVNSRQMWGLPPRCIKLSEFTWEEKFFGFCYKYYTRKFTFDTNVKTFDRLVPDEGTKVLKGHWHATSKLWELEDIDGKPPDPKNPTHFIRFQDFNGNTARVILDGNGQPYNPLLSDVVTTCPQCPYGSPRYLQVTNSDAAFDGSFQPQILVYSSGCKWGNGSVTLEYVEGEAPDPNEWVLMDLDSGATWVLVATSWGCLGPNQMSLTPDSPSSNPATVLVSLAVNSPGYRLIQKYNESDFFALGGIPFVL